MWHGHEFASAGLAGDLVGLPVAKPGLGTL